MADITVRKMTFEWPTNLPVVPRADDIGLSAELVALSFTLPYLEPYLIRTMRVAAKDVTDPELAADMKAFSRQEAFHHKNHSRINEVVRDQLSPSTAAEMRRLEDSLEADYQRFTNEKTLKFNLTYAEGFEAMTLALALSLLRQPTEGVDPSWQSLMEWHLAEEIEHRTVTFDAYDHVFGGYIYRTAVGTWAQRHFVSYVVRMATCLEREFRDDQSIRSSTVLWSLTKRRFRQGTVREYLRSISPFYNPARVETPSEVRALLTKYDSLAE